MRISRWKRSGPSVAASSGCSTLSATGRSCREVVGEVHGGHAAPPQLALEPVAVSQATLKVLEKVGQRSSCKWDTRWIMRSQSRRMLEQPAEHMDREECRGGPNGQGGIRTLEGVAPLPVFEANAAKAKFFVQSGNRLRLPSESSTQQKEIRLKVSRNSNPRLT